MPFRCTSSIVALFGLAMVCLADFRPEYHWVHGAGDVHHQEATGIGADRLGNVYVTGAFTGDLSFGATHLIGNANNQVFVAKFDREGNCVWARQAGGTESGVGHGIAVEADGASCIVGHIRGEARIGEETLEGSLLDDTAFVARADRDGNFVWARTVLPGGNRALAVATDASGNAYVTGHFRGSAVFGGCSLIDWGEGSAMFLVKYDVHGTPVWARQSNWGEDVEGQGVAVDANGNLAVVGRFRGSPQFGTLTLSSAGSADAFISRYDAGGGLLWARQAGGSDYDEAHAVAITPDNILLAVGYFRGTADFGPRSLTDGGAFLAAYGAEGTPLWAARCEGGRDDAGWGIAVDVTGNSYVAGGFSSWTFGMTNLATAGGFVEKLSPGGISVWRQSAGNSSATSIALDSFGCVLLAGGFWGACDFGTKRLASNGDLDAFVARLRPDAALKIRASNGGLQLAWPSFPPAFRLQVSHGRLDGWGDMPTNLPHLSGGEWHCDLGPADLEPSFFRLVQE